MLGLRRRLFATSCMVLVTLLYTIAGNIWMAELLLGRLERIVPPASPPGQPYDAVITLGGGTDIAPDGRAQLVEGGDRVLRALQAYLAHQALLLVATGSSIEGLHHRHCTGEEAVAIWRSLGVPEAATLVLSGPRNTSEEIQRVRAESIQRGWHHLAIVTSAYHMPRAQRLCRRYGLVADAIPCDYRGTFDPWSVAWLVPNGVAAERLGQAVWEDLAALAGR